MSELAKFDEMTLPLLPLRDVVIFPHMVIPLFVGRSESIRALEEAMDNGKKIFLVAQRDATVDSPKDHDIYEIGTVATVLQLLRLPDGTVKVLVEGVKRARLSEFIPRGDYLAAHLEALSGVEHEADPEVPSLVRAMLAQFERLIKLSKKIPPELLTSLSNIESAGRLTDSVAAHMTVKIEQRQKILEAIDVKERLALLHEIIAQELDMFEVEKRVQGRVKQQVEKSQRQYYLSEKIKAIQQELGELDEAGSPMDEVKNMQDKIEKAGMSDEAKEKCLQELNKLKMMPPMSAEATVVRNYIDTMLQVPWQDASVIIKDLDVAQETLEVDHYGLKEVKERILEYLAVQQRVDKLKGPILCLVGPPGVGKTSLGQSIANSTGREFARIALGGVRDEAEIRGHRRTYIGSMPGKIVQKLMKVKKRNPLFMLDEVDKMSADFRGDPSSALLEVLDPEQNHTFNDHYLEVDYDLSDVMFIATANSLDIPKPLLDRMEVIRLAGYTEDEKLNIAKRYLVSRQSEAAGLNENEINVTDGAIRDIIRYYTKEAGVRNLERSIAKVCRKVVRNLLTKKSRSKSKSEAKPRAVTITARNLEKYLGVKRFRYGVVEKDDRVGIVTGLAWTEVGGEILTIEAQVMSGKGKSLHTGRLGDVMQESIHAAMTVVRSRAAYLGIEDNYFHEHDFHIHVPEGATPKDGPSAGIGMVTALVSAITQIPIRADVAMTGEITLRGEVLPIGGLKEKLLAALRGGVKNVIIPLENERDLKEIPHNVTRNLNIHPVRWVDQVLALALTSMPVALAKEPEKTQKENQERSSNKKSSGRKGRQPEAH